MFLVSFIFIIFPSDLFSSFHLVAVLKIMNWNKLTALLSVSLSFCSSYKYVYIYRNSELVATLKTYLHCVKMKICNYFLIRSMVYTRRV